MTGVERYCVLLQGGGNVDSDAAAAGWRHSIKAIKSFFSSTTHDDDDDNPAGSNNGYGWLMTVTARGGSCL